MIPLIIFVGLLRLCFEVSVLKGKFVADKEGELAPPEVAEEMGDGFYVALVHGVFLFSIIAFYGIFYYGSFRIIGANPAFPAFLAYVPLALGISSLITDMFDYPTLIDKEKAIVKFKNRAYDKENRNFAFYKTVVLVSINLIIDLVILGAVVFTA